MSLAIVSRELSDSTKRIRIGNSQIARTMNIGSDWNIIRIGFQYGLTDAGGNLTGTPALWFGVLSNPQVDGNNELSNGVLSTSCSHFVGIKTSHTTWTRNGSTIIFYQVNNATSMQLAKKVGTTVTTSDHKRAGWIADPDNRRSVVLLEITKGSPNFTLQAATLRGDQALSDSTTLLVDIPYQKFANAMSNPTMAGAVTILEAGASFTAATAATFAVDEATDGYLDAIHFAWDRTDSLFEIDTIIVSKFS